MSMIADANATFCATLVDEWVRCGVRHAVVAPGSRSTPLALALAARDEIALHLVHDERVAAFFAVGVGLSGEPAVLACTSGTAAVNFHPAVVEAGLSNVPLLVVTADRPPELRGVGAPQTIDQVDLYLRSVRWSTDATVPDQAPPATWRGLARTAWEHAASGPVHLNVPFREPLVGTCGPLPEPLTVPPQPHLMSVISDGPIPDHYHGLQRGVIVAGDRSGVDQAEVTALAEQLGWPLLADPQSGVRSHPNAVPAFDPILRAEEFARSHAPHIVVRVGKPPASKVLNQWIAAADAPIIQVGGPGRVDPDGRVRHRATIADLAALTGASNTPWLARWRRASSRAERVLDQLLARELSEPAVARAIAQSNPGSVVVSSSMPVRDYEWYGGTLAAAHANRGANGIDGVISTAVGVALGGQPTTVLIGDIAFVHDSNALTALTRRPVDLRIVVIDNQGGGIFSFLPQRDLLERARFEQLFGTPHGTDLANLAAAHGVTATKILDRAMLDELLATPPRGVEVALVATNRDENVARHATLNAAIAAAL